MSITEAIDAMFKERNEWNSSIPQFAIYSNGSQNLGRCYNAYYSRVESRVRLTDLMRKQVGTFLLAGQELYDRTGEKPVEKVVTFTPSGTNPRDGKPWPDSTVTLYVYSFESRVDSSD